MAAVMRVCPVEALIANPLGLTVATEFEEELHVTELVKSRVLPSAKVPMAANCWLVPSAMEGLTGVSAIEVGTRGLTFSITDALIDPKAAVIALDPPLKPLATPAAEMAATDGWEEIHVTDVVRF
jgi:hypothetical protein